MNKKDFIKELEKRLEILDEKEIKDIVNEYKDIIDEKVKSGKSEEEAVSEFGSMDELATEILKAYKINPKYSNSNKDSLKEARENCEGWIKDTAKTLSDTAKGVYDGLKKSNNDISIELVFELIIKFILMLIILAILTLPFGIINSLGESIFNMAFYPADEVLGIVWKLFTSILYFGVCILIFIAMFKEYVNYNQNTVSVKETKNPNNKKKEKVVAFERVENATENVEVKKNEKYNKNNGMNSVLSILYKLFMVFVFLIPLWFMQLGLVVGLAVTIYYACIGINIWGLVVVMIGLVIGAGWATDIFMQLTFKIKKIHFYPAFVSLLIICIGSLIFASNILSFNYIDEAPKNTDFGYKTKIKEFTLSTLSTIYTSEYDTDFVVDPKLDDNVIRTEFTYYVNFRSVDGVSLDYDSNSNTYYLNYAEYRKTDFNDFKDSYNSLIDNLKDGEIYNYEKLSDVSIKIFANEDTMKQIRE